MQNSITRTLRLSVFSLLFTLLFTLPASAEECLTMPVIENSKMGYINAHGEPAGTHWEFLAAIEKRSGVCIHKVLLPIPRLWSAIELGDVDGGIVFRSAKRESLILPVAKTLNIYNVVLPKAGLTLNNHDDLSGLTIGITRGTQLDDLFDTENNYIKVQVNSYEQMVKMLATGRLDAISGSLNTLITELKKAGFIEAANIASPLELGEREQWLLMSRQSDHLDKLPALAKATNQLREEGLFEQIMDKYYGKGWRRLNSSSISD
jgi:polar amino acid transport system substrate-binding protein